MQGGGEQLTCGACGDAVKCCDWGDTGNDDRGNMVAIGPACMDCVVYAKKKGIEVKDLVKAFVESEKKKQSSPYAVAI